MGLLVQDFLLKHSFGELEEQHAVKAHFDRDCYKFSLNYIQGLVQDNDPLSQDCRGLVLTTPLGKSFLHQAREVNGRLSFAHIIPGETDIIALPMKRFFNHGQPGAADVDWNDPNLRVEEKRDGTLIIAAMDWIVNRWCCSTRGVPNADLPLDDYKDLTFRTLFDRAFKETMNIEFEDYAKANLNEAITYCFELTTPYNRIVNQHDDFRITLLAARHSTGLLTEIPIDGILTDLPRVKTYSLKTPDEIVKWVNEQDPLKPCGEGVVVKDSSFRRLKIKNPAYVFHSKARDIFGSSSRNCLELVLNGKEDDVLVALPPEIANNILELKRQLGLVIRAHDTAYHDILGSLDNPSKKDFALAVKKRDDVWSAPMFAIFDKKATSMGDFIDQQKDENGWSTTTLDRLLSLCKEAT